MSKHIDEAREDEEIRRGDRVRSFIEDEVIKDAFAQVEKDIFEHFRASNGGDLHLIHAEAQALSRLQTKLLAIADAGRTATRTRAVRERQRPSRP